jgi:hypothetical protein
LFLKLPSPEGNCYNAVVGHSFVIPQEMSSISLLENRKGHLELKVRPLKLKRLDLFDAKHSKGNYVYNAFRLTFY